MPMQGRYFLYLAQNVKAFAADFHNISSPGNAIRANDGPFRNQKSGMIKIFFPAGDTCRQSGSVPLLRRQAQPKKYRENILNVFRLFKKFQRVLEKQEHSGRTILRNAKRFNKPDTVHKHAQPIPVRPQTPGPPNQITLLQGKVHAVSGRFGTDLEFVEKIQTATESFAAPAAAKGKRRYDAVAARQHTQP